MRQLVDGVVIHGEDGTTVTLNLRLRRVADVAPPPTAGALGARVEVDRSGECPVVRVEGTVATSDAAVLRIRMLEASRGGTNRVELDLSGVTLLGSAGTRVVLAIARIAMSEGWRLVVHAPEGGVTRHLLEISGLGSLVEMR